MSGSRAAVLCLALVALLAAMVGGGAEWAQRVDVFGGQELVALAMTVAGAGWAMAGAVIAWHRPRNPLGWLILVVGLATQLSLAEEALARVGAIGLDDAAAP